MSEIKIAITTNIITTYRKGFYDRLFKNKDLHVDVFCQNHIPGMNLTSIHEDYPDNVHIINFISAKKEKICWQFIPWIKILKSYDVIFIAGNPRVISDFLFGILCRLLNKKVVMWTMAHSYRGNKISEKIRLMWTKIFPIILVYTDKEVEFLKKKQFNNHVIIGMNNGLDQKNIDYIINNFNNDKLEVWKQKNNLSNKTIIISCARLIKKNNFSIVLQALPEVIKKYKNLIWIVIGSGDDEFFLKDSAKKLNISEHILFLGSIYDDNELAPYFLSSSIFIHPSAIGLSLLHAFGYGLPVIVHGNEEFHNPEYAAFVNNKTGLNFKKDDYADLSNKIIELLDNPINTKIMGTNAQSIARNKYNVDIMVERFIDIAKICYNKNG